MLAGQQALFLQGIACVLESKFGFSIVAEVNCEDSLESMLEEKKPQWLFLDLNLFTENFYPILKKITRKNHSCKVVLFTDHYSVILRQKIEKLPIQGLFGKNASLQDFNLAMKCMAKGDRILTKPPQKQDGCHKTNGNEVTKDKKSHLVALSKREKEILNLICQGHSTIAISKQLFISKYTVETHRKNILRKLDLRSSTELVSYAYREGLVY